MESGVPAGVKGSLAGDLAHAFSGHCDAVGIVDEAVEDGIVERRVVADHPVPLLARILVSGTTATHGEGKPVCPGCPSSGFLGQLAA